MSEFFVAPPLLGILGLVVALVVYKVMTGYDQGDGVVKKIGDQIHLGAMVFMHREYKMLAMFAAVLLIGIVLSPLGVNTAIAFTVGALSSATAGYLGMFAATKANVRTAVAAHEHGAPAALSISFYGGSIMGLCVASLGLIGLGSLYWYLAVNPTQRTRFMASAWVPLSWRCFRALAVASSPRAPTWARTWWVKSKPAYPRMTPEPPA